jgi:hypothetical protein
MRRGWKSPLLRSSIHTYTHTYTQAYTHLLQLHVEDGGLAFEELLGLAEGDEVFLHRLGLSLLAFEGTQLLCGCLRDDKGGREMMMRRRGKE